MLSREGIARGFQAEFWVGEVGRGRDGAVGGGARGGRWRRGCGGGTEGCGCAGGGFGGGKAGCRIGGGHLWGMVEVGPVRWRENTNEGALRNSLAVNMRFGRMSRDATSDDGQTSEG